jgi:uncharacterized protein YcgL (UPF0745 family)
MKRLCSIYRSSKHEGMYLYVDKSEDMERVPAQLLKRFGKPEFAMALLLHAERELARVDVQKVLLEIEAQGFFLQIPPRPDEVMRQIHENNSKMGR